jgi:hypothetical protein
MVSRLLPKQRNRGFAPAKKRQRIFAREKGFVADILRESWPISGAKAAAFVRLSRQGDI